MKTSSEDPSGSRGFKFGYAKYAQLTLSGSILIYIDSVLFDKIRLWHVDVTHLNLKKLEATTTYYR